MKIKSTQEGKIWPVKYNLSFFFPHSKQLLLKKQSQIHWCMVFIVQLKWRIYKVNGQLELSPHLLPHHKECHCIVKSPSGWQVSHPALQAKHTPSMKNWCCKGTMVAESSPWLRATPEAEVAWGPLFSPALCLCMRVQSLIINATHFFPQRALVFAGEWCCGCAPNEALVGCYSQLKWTPGLPASCVTGLLAKSPFHLTHSSLVQSYFWF